MQQSKLDLMLCVTVGESICTMLQGRIKLFYFRVFIIILIIGIQVAYSKRTLHILKVKCQGLNCQWYGNTEIPGLET